MLHFLAIIGAVIVYCMALEEFPEFISKTINGLLLLALAVKLATYAGGISLPF